MPQHGFRAFLIMALSGCALGCDHGTKLVAERALGAGRVVTIVPHAVELRYARNEDVAFSALSHWDLPHKSTLLLVVSLLVLAFAVGLWLRHRHMHRGSWGLTDAGFGLVLAGAIGNVLDRMVRGYVVDFIHVSRWPIFNIADACIVLGLIALGLSRSREPVLSPRA
jgi:signal peptidase II